MFGIDDALIWGPMIGAALGGAAKGGKGALIGAGAGLGAGLLAPAVMGAGAAGAATGVGASSAGASSGAAAPTFGAMALPGDAAAGGIMGGAPNGGFALSQPMTTAVAPQAQTGLLGQMSDMAKTAAPIMSAAQFGRNMLTSQQKSPQVSPVMPQQGGGAQGLAQLVSQNQQAYLTPLQQAEQLRQQRRQQMVRGE